MVAQGSAHASLPFPVRWLWASNPLEYQVYCGQWVDCEGCLLCSSVQLVCSSGLQREQNGETGPEEGGSTPGSWILVVSPGPHEGGALGPTSLVGAAEAMQAPGGVPGEEAVLFWVEEGAALEEGEVAAIGQELDRIRRC